MTTDFNYGKSTIITTGPVKPKDRNVPMNARYRVEKYADIATIPVPAVGELVFVLSDENNDNKQNIYVIKSLKPSNLGVADSLVDEVVPLKTFLGTDDINLSDYVTEDELNNRGYATTAEVDQKIANAVTGGTVDLSSYATKEYVDGEIDNISIPTKLSEFQNDMDFIVDGEEVNATSLNGKKFSEPMTKAQYDAIADKDEDTIYLIDDDSSIQSVPNYTQTDVNKVLTVNDTGTGLEWTSISSQNNNGTLSVEQVEQLNTAYNHSQEAHVKFGDIPTKTSQLINDSGFSTTGGGSNIEIVDDLITGGSDKALSAEQGKILKQSMDGMVSGEVSGYLRHPLYGKRGLALGDSLTHGGSYHSYVKETVKMASYLNLGSSGATCALTNASNNLIQKVDDLDPLTQEYDFISVMIGTNDICINRTPLGTIYDTSKYTFLGAYRYCMETLIRKYPKATIVAMTPPKLVADDDYLKAFTGGSTQQDFNLAIKMLCYELSIPVLDVFTSNLCCILNKADKYMNGTDTIHLSSDGQENIGIMLAGFTEGLNSENSSFIINKLIERLNDIECNIPMANNPHHHTDFVSFDTNMLEPTSIKEDETITYDNQEVVFSSGSSGTNRTHASLKSGLFSDIEFSKAGSTVIVGVSQEDPRQHLTMFVSGSTYMGKVSKLNPNNTLTGMDLVDDEAIVVSYMGRTRVSIRGSVVTVYNAGRYGLLDKIGSVDISSKYPGYIPCLGLVGNEIGVRVRYLGSVELISPTAITITNAPSSLNVNDTVQLNVNYTPSNANQDKTITWSSSSNQIATVSNNGLVTALSEGSVTITAKTQNNVSNSVNIQIVGNSVVDPDPITPTPGQSTPGTISDGLIRSYNFAGFSNDGRVTQVADDTGNGEPFVLHDFKYDETSGFNNNMLYLSEDTDYAVCENFGMDSTNDWTLEIIESYPALASPTVNDSFVNSYGSWDNNNWSGGFGGYIFGLRDESHMNGTGLNQALSAGCKANDIAHIFIVHNSTDKTIKVYKEKQFVGNEAQYTDTIASFDKLYLGYKGDSGESKYPGKIGLVKLYDKQLTEAEMNTNIDAEKAITRS